SLALRNDARHLPCGQFRRDDGLWPLAKPLLGGEEISIACVARMHSLRARGSAPELSCYFNIATCAVLILSATSDTRCAPLAALRPANRRRVSYRQHDEEPDAPLGHIYRRAQRRRLVVCATERRPRHARRDYGLPLSHSTQAGFQKTGLTGGRAETLRRTGRRAKWPTSISEATRPIPITSPCARPRAHGTRSRSPHSYGRVSRPRWCLARLSSSRPRFRVLGMNSSRNPVS